MATPRLEIMNESQLSDFGAHMAQFSVISLHIEKYLDDKTACELAMFGTDLAWAAYNLIQEATFLSDERKTGLRPPPTFDCVCGVHDLEKELEKGVPDDISELE